MVEIKCDSCGSVVDTVPIDRAGLRLIELESDEICSAWCPHCDSLNAFLGFNSIERFICQQCGKSVSVEGPVQ